MFVNSIEIYTLGFGELLENILCTLLITEALSLQKVVKVLEIVVSHWQEVGTVIYLIFGSISCATCGGC